MSKQHVYGGMLMLPISKKSHDKRLPGLTTVWESFVYKNIGLNNSKAECQCYYKKQKISIEIFVNFKKMTIFV